MQEKCIATPMPNGESYEDVKARVNDFINFIKKEYEGKHIAIVAHKAPQLAPEAFAERVSAELVYYSE